MAFLAEKERRSGSRPTVEGNALMLWPFLGGLESTKPELTDHNAWGERPRCDQPVEPG